MTTTVTPVTRVLNHMVACMRNNPRAARVYGGVTHRRAKRAAFKSGVHNYCRDHKITGVTFADVVAEGKRTGVLIDRAVGETAEHHGPISLVEHTPSDVKKRYQERWDDRNAFK